MRSHLLTVVVTVLLFTSCATLSRNGVGRVKYYTIESERLPKEFNGFTFAFLSDTHYPSKFTRKRLGRLVRKLRESQPQMVLLGGDYVTSDEYANELFDSISSVKTPHGIYAVLGNHEFSRTSLIKERMEQYGIYLLDDKHVNINNGASYIAVAGVHNPFKVDENYLYKTNSLSDSLFTILLSHTPDYAEDTDVQADIVLSGHTHGGQVSLFGLYTPVTNSRYETRFNRGLNYTDASVPVITTTGVGTSRRKVRFCVPSEIVFVRLLSL